MSHTVASSAGQAAAAAVIAAAGVRTKDGKIVGTWIGPADKNRVVTLITPHL